MKTAALVILISPGNKELTRSTSEVMWGWIKNVVKVSMTGYIIEIPKYEEKITVHEFMKNYAPDDGEIILVRAVQTCSVMPSQWDGWDINGRYWYLKFRSGRGTIGRTYDVDEAVSSFRDDGAPDITLEDMCTFLGVKWAPEVERQGTTWEDPPRV